MAPSDAFAIAIAAGTTIAAALRASPLSPLETRILTGHALGLSRIELITRADTLLDGEQAARLTQLITSRLRGEPIAYLVGEREFFGLPLEVNADVLIPRPDTELLVELALERLPQEASVLDMGTGSGAIAVAIAHARPDAKVTALDASTAALTVARRNAARHGCVIELLQSDWYAAVAGRRFDLIASNPPYIRAGDAHLSQGDLRFEPVSALTDHGDGLSALRTIIGAGRDYLASRGWLLLEHGYDQADAVRGLLRQQGFVEVQSWRDLAGIERVSGACAPE